MPKTEPTKADAARRQRLLDWHKSLAECTGTLALAYGRTIKRSDLLLIADRCRKVAGEIDKLIKSIRT